MNAPALPNTRTVELIHDDALALLWPTTGERLHPDGKILLASLLFADNEGVTHHKPWALQHWSRRPEDLRADLRFVEQRIAHLAEVGALAPRSTTTELRTMIGRRAEGEEAA